MSEGDRYLDWSLDDLNKMYPHVMKMYVAVDVGVKPGEIVILKDRNHVGKSTFHLPQKIWLGIDHPF